MGSEDVEQISELKSHRVVQKVETFSERIASGKLKVDSKDLHAIANMMLFEFNLVAGRLLILQFQLIEVIKAAPRFVSEYL